MPTRLRRLLPDHPVARRLSVQSVLYALGEGVFATGKAVYFTQIVGLLTTHALDPTAATA